MTRVHVGVEDARGWKIVGATVKLTDNLTGIVVGTGTTDSKGEILISFTGTPFGNYRAEATTPKGHQGRGDFSLDWLASSVNVNVRTTSPDEGDFGGTVEAWWNSLGPWGQVGLVGGSVLGIGLLAWFLTRRRE